MTRQKLSDWTTPEALELLEGFARNGMIDVDIAKRIGISRATFYAWKKASKEFSDALKKGKEVVDYAVESALLRKALGQEVTETRIETDEEGHRREITVKKQIPGDVTAQIFWLKNRKPGAWRDKVVSSVSIAPDEEILKEVEDFINGEDINYDEEEHEQRETSV